MLGGFFKDTDGRNNVVEMGSLPELAIFSFHPVKHIACGEGGMNYNQRSHFVWAAKGTANTRNNPWKKWHLKIPASLATGESDSTQYPAGIWKCRVGYNYGLTDFQAALGISQLKSADAGLKRSGAGNCCAVCWDVSGYSTYHYINRELLKGTRIIFTLLKPDRRLELYNHLREKGILLRCITFQRILCHITNGRGGLKATSLCRSLLSMLP